jgi:hypothetical protein
MGQVRFFLGDFGGGGFVRVAFARERAALLLDVCPAAMGFSC